MSEIDQSSKQAEMLAPIGGLILTKCVPPLYTALASVFTQGLCTEVITKVISLQVTYYTVTPLKAGSLSNALSIALVLHIADKKPYALNDYLSEMVLYFGQEIKSLEIQVYQRIVNPKCKDYRKWKRIFR